MGVRKRKAAEVDEYEGWVPTVPAPSYGGYSRASSSSAYASGSGSSSNPLLLDYVPPQNISAAKPPPAKRAKKQKDPDALAPEKRGAIFKKKCPQNILERVYRVMEQRMFLLDRTRNGNELKEEFAVQGSTGNVYTVTIDKKPSCDCPDALKGNHCKHILFIFLKVLQVTQASGVWYQKALLTSELEEIFTNAPRAPEAVANARVREAYAKATGKASSSLPKDSGAKKRLPEKGDDCPVCYEDMFNAKENTLTFCDKCGNGLHRQCFQQWAKAARGNATCVFVVPQLLPKFRLLVQAEPDQVLEYVAQKATSTLLSKRASARSVIPVPITMVLVGDIATSGIKITMKILLSNLLTHNEKRTQAGSLEYGT